MHCREQCGLTLLIVQHWKDDRSITQKGSLCTSALSLPLWNEKEIKRPELARLKKMEKDNLTLNFDSLTSIEKTESDVFSSMSFNEKPELPRSTIHFLSEQTCPWSPFCRAENTARSVSTGSRYDGPGGKRHRLCHWWPYPPLGAGPPPSPSAPGCAGTPLQLPSSPATWRPTSATLLPPSMMLHSPCQSPPRFPAYSPLLPLASRGEAPDLARPSWLPRQLATSGPWSRSFCRAVFQAAPKRSLEERNRWRESVGSANTRYALCWKMSFAWAELFICEKEGGVSYGAVSTGPENPRLWLR